MEPFTPKSAVQQLADHLRSQIASGAIGDSMPGINQLVRELGMGTNTVLAAVATLEREGLLENRGGRRSRKVLRDVSNLRGRGMKVEILCYEKGNKNEGFLVDLRHRLNQAGHTASFSSLSLLDLRMDPTRVARYVKRVNANAWVVFVGSRPVLEWFASQPFPSFALLGRSHDVPMAGLSLSKTEALGDILKTLVSGGHRRIVLLTREERRKPYPGQFERHFLAKLEALGIPTGPYNLPDWDNDAKGFQSCLVSLFSHTPPTAIVFDDPFLFLSAQPFFSHRRIQIPEDMSVIMLDSHPVFDWSDPVPTHFKTDPNEWVKKVMRWINRVSLGKTDLRKTIIKAEIVKGGTINKVRG